VHVAIATPVFSDTRHSNDKRMGAGDAVPYVNMKNEKQRHTSVAELIRAYNAQQSCFY